jgi:hypothetical protein
VIFGGIGAEISLRCGCRSKFSCGFGDGHARCHLTTPVSRVRPRTSAARVCYTLLHAP